MGGWVVNTIGDHAGNGLEEAGETAYKPMAAFLRSRGVVTPDNRVEWNAILDLVMTKGVGQLQESGRACHHDNFDGGEKIALKNVGLKERKERAAKMGHDAKAVANALIMKGVENGKPLTPLQIIKLTYLCQAWMLAMYGRPMFRQKVQAWQYGPVIPQVYHSVKHHGRDPVHTPLNAKPAIFSRNERHILDEVYRVYGDLSGVELSSLTHADGSPWHQVANGYPSRHNHEISHARMERYYGDQLARFRESNPAD